LERIKTIQNEDPFKTRTIEDSRVNAMVIAFVFTGNKGSTFTRQTANKTKKKYFSLSK